MGLNLAVSLKDVGGTLFLIALVLALLGYPVLLLWSVNRVYYDAEARGWPGFWIALAVFLTWPWGWILYSVQRRKDDSKQKP